MKKENNMAITSTITVNTQSGIVPTSTVILNVENYNVLSYNLETATFEWVPLLSQSLSLVTNSITIYFASGNSITCAPTQLIFKGNAGFVEASTLNPADMVLSIDKNEIVRNIITNPLQVSTYSFQVSNSNNYFANGILVSDA
jgi:hypothetical protein